MAELGVMETLQAFLRISVPQGRWVLCTFTGSTEVPAGAVLSRVLAQTEASLPQNTHGRGVTH